MLCRLKDCGKCGGDLFLDFDEWRCFQCGRIYYPKPSPMELLPDAMEVHAPLFADESPDEAGHDRDRPKVRRSPRRINVMVAAKNRSEEKWWSNNKQVIYHLDRGNSVQQTAEIVGRGTRQVRMIRERLNDLRATALEPAAAD